MASRDLGRAVGAFWPILGDLGTPKEGKKCWFQANVDGLGASRVACRASGCKCSASEDHLGPPWVAKGGALGSCAAPIGSQEVPNRVEIGALGVYFMGPVDPADFDDGIVRDRGFRAEEVQIRRFWGQAVNLQLQLSQGAS